MLIIVPQTNVERGSYSPLQGRTEGAGAAFSNLFPNRLSRNGLIEMEKRERVRVQRGPQPAPELGPLSTPCRIIPRIADPDSQCLPDARVI